MDSIKSAMFNGSRKIQRDRQNLSPEVMMEVRKIRLHTIMTYGAGISACEKSLEWRRALQLLAEVPQNSLEMNLGANADQRSTQFNLVSRFRPSRRPVKNRRAKGPLRNNWRTRRNIDIENPISPDIMWLLFYPHY